MELNTKRILTVLGGIEAIDLAIGTGQLKITGHMMPEAYIPAITDWAAFFAFVISIVMTCITGGSWAMTPGDGSAPSPVARIAAAAMLAIGLLFWSTGDVSAQQRLTGNPIKDFAPPGAKPLGILVNPDPFQDLMTKMESVKADVVAGLVAALQEADKDAGEVINATTGDVKDPIAHACYPAQIKFLQSLPVSQPITSPPPFNVIVLFQRKRDFVAQIKAGIPVYLKLGCVPLFGDEAQTFVQTMLMVGVKIAPAAATAMFPALAPVTLPAMTLLP